MWEGLARTRRQDQALHGAAKLVNLVIGLIALPVWLVGQALGERIRHVFTWLERRKPRELPVPPEGERSMEALMEDLRGVPEHLAQHPVSDLRTGMRDISNFVLAQSREGAVLGYNYPAQFADHVFEGADGERIAATIALQEAARPGLIVVHGIFTSSRFDYVRRIAVRAFYEWGFNVAVLDQRSFGLTEITSSAPSTGGWKEGLDLIALGRYMKELGSSSVGALGISLGGSSVLNASDPEGAEQALDGGLLAVSPPAEPKEVWGRLSEPVPRSHPRYPIHKAFQAALTSRVRSGRWPEEAEDMSKAMGAISAPYYGVSAEEIWRNASGTRHVAGARVPLLVIHPHDDPIIKVEEAEKLAIVAGENDLVRVWIVPHGSHGMLEAADPVWTNSVYRKFFERWAAYAERGAVADRANGKLVYSEE